MQKRQKKIDNVYERMLKERGIKKHKRWNSYLGKCEKCGEPQTKQKNFVKLCDTCK